MASFPSTRPPPPWLRRTEARQRLQLTHFHAPSSLARTQCREAERALEAPALVGLADGLCPDDVLARADRAGDAAAAIVCAAVGLSGIAEKFPAILQQETVSFGPTSTRFDALCCD